jgi:hypothetical protein
MDNLGCLAPSQSRQLNSLSVFGSLKGPKRTLSEHQQCLVVNPD